MCISDMKARAENYCKYSGSEIIQEPQLGAGTDGTVWQSTAGTAIKSFERAKNFHDELVCYRRFKQRSITQIRGFAVPELEGFDDKLMVIEMSIVEPPYLLDFGKVYIDQPPAYLSDKTLMNNWLAECRELFGADWPEVQTLLNVLRGMGIHYVDPKPANIRFA